MRLDHLLSKDRSRESKCEAFRRAERGHELAKQVSRVRSRRSREPVALLLSSKGTYKRKDFGDDALRGDTRSHPEHDG